MSYGEKAVQIHAEGANCCQAVFMSCCEKYGINPEQAWRLGAFFGGGFRRGEVCGAVSGAIMALGMAYGDENNRQCSKSREFMRAFEEKFGSVLCRELLANNRKKMCPELIRFAAEYLEDELK